MTGRRGNSRLSDDLVRPSTCEQCPKFPQMPVPRVGTVGRGQRPSRKGLVESESRYAGSLMVVFEIRQLLSDRYNRRTTNSRDFVDARKYCRRASAVHTNLIVSS